MNPFFNRLEDSMRVQFATIPAPLDPSKDPGVFDVTPETLGDRSTVAHIRRWQEQRDRNATPRTPREPTPPGEAA